MRRFGTPAVLLLTALLGRATAQDTAEERDKQLKSIVGTWNVAWVIRAGEKPPDGVPEAKWLEQKAQLLVDAKLTLQIKEDGALILSAQGKGQPNALSKGIYRLEYDGSRWVMITVDSKAQTERGIFEVRPGRWYLPETLLICTSIPGQERPTDFAATNTTSLLRLHKSN
jgi:hypothetical protein